MRKLYRYQGVGQRRVRTLAAAAATSGVVILLVAASCRTSPSLSEPPHSPSPTTLTAAPDPATFSGVPASALASLAASIKADSSSRAAAAASAAATFDASVSAETERVRAQATQVLQGVQGTGNALGDITITGIPRSSTGGLHAVTVTIVNSTSATASYAVQVDFLDVDGNTVDTSVVGVENLPPGETATPMAFSRQPGDLKLLPVVAKAQRY
ncbi:FxLYD domain-containing protein [Kitasatospora sp. NPDC054939]